MRTTIKRAVALLHVLIITLTLIAFPCTLAQAQTASATATNKTATSTAAVFVAGDPLNTAIELTNNGSVTVYLGFTSAVTSSTGIPLYANTVKTFLNVGAPIYGITASSTSDVRIVTLRSAGSNKPPGAVSTNRTITSGISNAAAASTVGCSDGSNIVACTPLIYDLTTAITANSTTTSTAAGTYAITSNATGLGILFVSDASKWQLAGPASNGVAQSESVTIATTSTSDTYISMPYAGIVTGIDFTSLDGLTANDTNYITWTVVNLGQSGVGTTALLAVSDANTTKATGGSTITALARRTMTVHGTAGNLVVAKGDVIRCRATATGTLVGTVTKSRYVFYVTRTA